MLKEKSRSVDKSFFILVFLIFVTIAGPMVYLSVASAYHFVVLGIFAYTLVKHKFSIKMPKNSIIRFFNVWLILAFVSNIWSPSKKISMQYTYYIFLIWAMVYIFSVYFKREMLPNLIKVMVVILAILNGLAIWEVFTGEHINPGYLDDPDALQILLNMPSTFFFNPNDFATYVVQIIPFNLAGISSDNKLIKNIAMINVPFSVFSIFAAEARTQMIVIFVILVIYVIVLPSKKDIFKIAVGITLGVVLLTYVYPDMRAVLEAGMKSISGGEIEKSAGTGSMAVRIALLKNGAIMLMNSFGIGVGAGCHRILMPDYSLQYNFTRGIEPMHNFLGELFVDYGVIAGVSFVVVVLNTIVKLVKIRKKIDNKSEKVFFLMLVVDVLVFVVSAMCPSSVIQLPSMWITFCVAGALLNDAALNSEAKYR